MKLVLAMLIMLMPTPAYAFQCMPLEDMLREIFTVKRLGYMANAIDNKGRVHMFYYSRRTHHWAEIMVDNDLEACLIFEGQTFYFAMERKA